jgi:hypothetical protein
VGYKSNEISRERAAGIWRAERFSIMGKVLRRWPREVTKNLARLIIWELSLSLSLSLPFFL